MIDGLLALYALLIPCCLVAGYFLGKVIVVEL